MKKVGYARVSTVGQELEVQIEMLEKEGCDIIFSEKFTGAKMERPQLEKALKELKAADTLVVTKLDRLARNTEEGIRVITNLLNQDIKVQVLNMGLIENTNMGKFIMTILLAVAEMERTTIIERMAEGKALARLRDDYQEGRKKKFTKKQIEHAITLKETHSYKQVEEITGISKSTLVRAIRKDKS